MQTLTFECEVTVELDLVLRLPTTVAPGRHRIALVIDPVESPASLADLNPVADTVPPRTGLWARLAAVREQAAQAGELAEPMSWDDVLAEAQRRRGDLDD